MWRCSGVMLVLLCLFSTNGLCVRFDGTSQQTCRAKVFCASSHSLCCSVHHVGCWSFAKQVVSWKMWRCSGAMLVLLCLFSTVLLLLFPGMTRECATNGLCVRVHRRTAYVAVHHVGCWSFAKQVVSWGMVRSWGVMLVLLCLFSTVLLLLFPGMTRECATNGLCVRFDGTSQQTCRAKVFCASSHSLCCSVHHVGCWSFAKQVVSWKMWRCSGVMLVLLCLFSTVLLLLFPSTTRECATNGLCVRFDGTSQQTCRAKGWDVPSKRTHRPLVAHSRVMLGNKSSKTVLKRQRSTNITPEHLHIFQLQ